MRQIRLQHVYEYQLLILFTNVLIFILHCQNSDLVLTYVFDVRFQPCIFTNIEQNALTLPGVEV